MFRYFVIAGALLSVILLAGVSLAQDGPMRDPTMMNYGFGSGMGFGSGGNFGSSMGLDGFGGSMSSRGTVCGNYGFGTGFKPDTNRVSGPMSSGEAWSTGRTGNPGGGWNQRSNSEFNQTSSGGWNSGNTWQKNSQPKR